jgi:hypothetical protein
MQRKELSVLAVCVQICLTKAHAQLPVWVLELGTIQANIVVVYLSVCLPTYLWLKSPCGPWPLFQFLNLYTPVTVAERS